MTKSLTIDAVLDAVRFRCIGPTRGGRVVAVAGHPHNQAEFYFGAVAGGVWKTEDAGTTWRCITDGQLKTASVGALCVSDSHPNVIYAGMGETTIRIDVSYGDGVYKSTDGGRTWKHLGLADTRHIGRVRVHPTNPDLVYVAALGHAFGPNEERGVFRSQDGGATWEKVLYVSDKAGAVDLSIDAQNPSILYASIWQTYRNFWELNSGGPDSGLWRSRDGGDTWERISDNPGFPQTLKGKIGVAASPVKAGRVWAMVEAKDASGLYRSDDFGATWQKLNDSIDLWARPWYYMHVYADPQDEETVYVLNLGMQKSTDGGKTFVEIPTPHGDNHDLWIDPRNNKRMIEGNDGGACVSFDAGASFSTIYNQMTAQFYHMDVDDEFPYRVYGTQQDNSSVCVPSDTIAGPITWADCEVVGTGESGYIAVKPDDVNTVYVGAVGSSPGGQGALQKVDRISGQIQLVNVWPEDLHGRGVGEAKVRFPWTFPILFSPHDPNVLYTCGNIAYRSTNGGHSWEAISPDLTRADMSKLGPSGGPITLDTSGAEHYATIYAFRESPHEPGVFMAGSDDGLVHISRDGGASWQNITPPDLPEWSYIRTVEPSPFDAATWYLAATRYKLDDPAPYLYKTTDYGASWSVITAGIPADDYTRVIRCDPNVRGLLYAGTELGLYVSFDDGASWRRWHSTLPVAPVYDIKLKGTDLILATHGRGFWIGDNLTLLYQGVAQTNATDVTLFAPGRTWRILPDLFADWMPTEGKIYGVGLGSGATILAHKDANGQIKRTFLDAGEGMPRGAVIDYFLPETPAPETPVTLAILDAAGNVLREYSRKPNDYDKWDDKRKGMEPGPWLPLHAGMNRFVWNLRLPGATKVPGNKTAGAVNEGPFVLPGRYHVRLTVGETVATQGFEVVNDPRVRATLADLEEQHALLLRIRDKISDAHAAVNRLRSIREQVEAWQKRAGDAPTITAAATALLEKLAAVEDALILPGEQKVTYGLIARSRLNEALASTVAIVGSADARPTEQAYAIVEHYATQIDAQIAALDAALTTDLAALNQAIQAAALAPIA
ncbi:MAG TPA: glycosyl hydrolase [Chloroflexi bacterium]|nr:glycosyl hydrolase [Chloroflexota bacterium]HHW87540.1 glycosyl hydrolase [Chloroflexota bacterium]